MFCLCIYDIQNAVINEQKCNKKQEKAVLKWLFLVFGIGGSISGHMP
jgi:hypothetical protein